MLKVGDLLSGPTIVSSRTLTIFAATIIVIWATNTKLEDVPAVSWISKGDIDPYWVILIILIFMSASHAINWWNDIGSHKARSELRAFRATVKRESDLENPTKFLDSSSSLSTGSQNSLENVARIFGKTRRQMMLEIPTDTRGIIGAIFDDHATHDALVAEAEIQKSEKTNFIVSHGLHCWVPALASVTAYFIVVRKLFC